MSVTTAAGTLIAISSVTPTTKDQQGYQASVMNWINIGEIVDGGEHGRNYAKVEHKPIGSRGVRKFKGSFDEGTKTLQLGLDTDDAGQVVAKAASTSDNDYYFRVTYPSGDIDYFSAKVMSFMKSTPNVDSIVGATIALELTTDSNGVGIIEVLA